MISQLADERALPFCLAQHLPEIHLSLTGIELLATQAVGLRQV
jgi:hypothetical protein